MATKKKAASKKEVIRVEDVTTIQKTLFIDDTPYTLSSTTLADFNEDLQDGYIFSDGIFMTEVIERAENKDELLAILRGVIKLVEQVK
jgi:hypothetical protein